MVGDGFVRSFRGGRSEKPAFMHFVSVSGSVEVSVSGSVEAVFGARLVGRCHKTDVRQCYFNEVRDRMSAIRAVGLADGIGIR